MTFLRTILLRPGSDIQEQKSSLARYLARWVATTGCNPTHQKALSYIRCCVPGACSHASLLEGCLGTLSASLTTSPRTSSKSWPFVPQPKMEHAATPKRNCMCRSDWNNSTWRASARRCTKRCASCMQSRTGIVLWFPFALLVYINIKYDQWCPLVSFFLGMDLYWSGGQRRSSCCVVSKKID